MGNTLLSLDSILAGRFLGTDALTAMQQVTLLHTKVGNFFIEMTAGILVLASKSKHKETVKYNSFITGLIFMSLATLVLIVFKEKFIDIMNVHESIVDLYSNYYDVYIISTFMWGIFDYLMYLSIGMGDSKTPSKYLFLVHLFNTSIDFILVQFIDDIRYLSVTTTLFYGLASILLFRKLNIRRTKIVLDHFKEILKIGVPASFIVLCYSISNIFITSVVNTYSISIVKAYSITDPVYLILDSIGSALYSTSATICASGKYMIRELRKFFIKFTYITTTITSLLGFVIVQIYFSIVTTDPNILEYRYIVTIPVVTHMVCNVMDCLTGVHSAINLAKETAMCTFIAVFVRVIIVATLGSEEFLYLLLAYPISWVLSNILMEITYRRAKNVIFK